MQRNFGDRAEARISLGFKLLDDLTGGGLMGPGIYLVLGDPGTKKGPLCMRFLYEGLKRGEAGLFISFDELPQRVMESMTILGWDVTEYRKRGCFLILDCISGPAGLPCTEKYSVVSMGDLTTLSIKLTEAIKELSRFGRVRVAVVTLSALLLHLNVDLVLKFLETSSVRFKSQGVPCLAALNRRGFDDKTIATMEELCDGVIELKLEETEGGTLQRFVRIRKMIGTNYDTRWRALTIKPQKGFVSGPSFY